MTDQAASPPAAARIREVEPDVAAALAAIPDPVGRAKAALEAIEATTALHGRLTEVRRDAVRELRGLDQATGRPRRSWEEIGALLGVRGSRAHQLAKLDGDRTAPRPTRSQSEPQK